MSTAEAGRIREVEQENRELKCANEILPLCDTPPSTVSPQGDQHRLDPARTPAREKLRLVTRFRVSALAAWQISYRGRYPMYAL